jgi:hypothetical protein
LVINKTDGSEDCLILQFTVNRILFGLQDKDKELKIDWKRVGITSSFGFAFVGPVGHYWLVPFHLRLWSYHYFVMYYMFLYVVV